MSIGQVVISVLAFVLGALAGCVFEAIMKIGREREKWRELVGQLIACHEEPSCPAV